MAATVEPGVIMAWGGEQAELSDSWLICDGSSYSKDDYPYLFEAIGTAWGGDDAQFNVPDLRGMFLRGVSDGTDVDPEAAHRNPSNPGGNSGDAVGSVQADALQEHRHNISRHNICGSNGSKDTDTDNEKYNADPNLGSLEVTNAIGCRVSSETRPKNANVYWIIRAKRDDLLPG